MSFRYEFLLGTLAAQYVPVVWPQIPDRVRRYVLWDVPEGRKEAELYQQLSRCISACFVWKGKDLQALAWLQTSKDLPPRSVISHFFFTSGTGNDEISATYWDVITRLGLWDYAYAVLPLSFRHVRAYAKKFGFIDLACLYQTIYTNSHGMARAIIMRKPLR